MQEKFNQLKQKYTDLKNKDGYQLTHNINCSFAVHKKSSPDKPIFNMSHGGSGTTDVIDIALIAGGAAAACVLLCAACALCKAMRK